jgi:putative membrane protein
LRYWTLVPLLAPRIDAMLLTMDKLRNKTSNELAEIRSDLATTRTVMAADRTLMAWVRTALSLLSFGFTIYKVLQGFAESGALGMSRGGSPRSVGLFLTGMGTLAMVMGTIEYWQTLKALQELRTFPLTRPPLIMAVLMSVTGTFLFFSIITKLF